VPPGDPRPSPPPGDPAPPGQDAHHGGTEGHLTVR
jgi:hypothetical protein